MATKWRYSGYYWYQSQAYTHFVYCPKEVKEKLNSKLGNKLQEILGIVDAHKPKVEVLITGIGSDQIKLSYFEPKPLSPVCFAQVGADGDALLQRLEQRMGEYLTRGMPR